MIGARCRGAAATRHLQHGAAGMSVVLGAVMFAIVGLAGVTAVGDLALTSARARVAADAAALAAVGSSPLSRGDAARPRDVAGRTAAANGADLLDVQEQGWPLRYEVTVSVAPATPWVRRTVGPVQARSAAALRPTDGGR